MWNKQRDSVIRRMTMNEVLEKIQKIGIVPVVGWNDAKDAAPLAKALCDGGLPCAEVTFRTEAAEESIRIMAEQFPQMLVGAGTVLTTEQVDRAVAAGAKFIVSPSIHCKLIHIICLVLICYKCSIIYSFHKHIMGFLIYLLTKIGRASCRERV